VLGVTHAATGKHDVCVSAPGCLKRRRKPTTHTYESYDQSPTPQLGGSCGRGGTRFPSVSTRFRGACLLVGAKKRSEEGSRPREATSLTPVEPQIRRPRDGLLLASFPHQNTRPTHSPTHPRPSRHIGVRAATGLLHPRDLVRDNRFNGLALLPPPTLLLPQARPRTKCALFLLSNPTTTTSKLP
jgi:hypothetical protein